nr:MAG TPA: hypothetical protein [Caudoviricetes sp.]
MIFKTAKGAMGDRIVAIVSFQKLTPIDIEIYLIRQTFTCS